MKSKNVDFIFIFLLNIKVTVLGIHSPKYEHEKNKVNVRHAIDEQSISFPIINDNGLQIWKQIGCQIWPTVLVFGSDFVPIYIFEGENHVRHLEYFLQPILNYYKSNIRAIATTQTNAQSTRFTYPSHVCVTSNGQICVSFAGSNQLILCEIDGKVLVKERTEFDY